MIEWRLQVQCTELWAIPGNSVLSSGDLTCVWIV